MPYIVPAQTFDGFAIPEIPFYDIGSGIDVGTRASDSATYTVTSSAPGVYIALMRATNQSADATTFVAASKTRGATVTISTGGWSFRVDSSRTINGETVYYGSLNFTFYANLLVDVGQYDPAVYRLLPDRWGWLMVYGGYIGYSVTYDLVNCIGSSENPVVIAPNAIITPARFTADASASFNSASAWIEGSGFEGSPIIYTWDPEEGLLRIGIVTSDIVVHVQAYIDPYSSGGDSETGGGTGDHDESSDPIDFPSLPSISATDTGLITLYNPSLNEIRALASYMWTNPAFDISAWKKIFADPIDAILGLSIVPVAVPDGGVRPIAVGNLTTDVNMNVAAQQYIEVRCGALTVTEFWGSYLDYEPYTKAEIYLPYCGVHQLSVDDIMNKIIEVRYHIDILSGSCCAYVKCGDSVLYQFIGQCSSSIPIASGDFSEIVNSALNAALAIGSAIATSGAGVPLATALHTAGAAGAAASAAVNVQKEKIQKSGSLSGTGGMLAIQKPYLILTRPRQAHPANQYHYTGYPSFITENLSGLGGYTEIEEIHLENVPATDSELNEIVTLLESGVIF